jgi:hypothetical protein
MRFTADEAFDAQTDGEPIMMEPAAAKQILANHDVDEPWEVYEREMIEAGNDPLDAGHLLAWLGY